MNRYPFATSDVAGMVMLSFGGARSERDLNCQSAKATGRDAAKILKANVLSFIVKDVLGMDVL